ncbi:hypothetical protein [Cyclobacterium jeungdonense]|uniref:HNH endonuclease n=1 Tax=Cyclobacterium jeungdonense TaxID=708087 RepID=A0ABT8CBJ7_9BACT|nr:hypothetical protein [Cyclobacterium jeungdonense]MDN3689056.1 hypothetical protein [Cyclobacterium jeungdonense]
MTTDQQTFLRLSVIEHKKYDEIEQAMGIDRLQLSKWWDELKVDREQLSKIRQIWARKGFKIDFWEFHKWYTNAERKCHYCNITEQQIKILIVNGQIHTKRLTTRGKTLEIERCEPNKSYDETDNLVFCCYWCNNAKTDEFTVKEFEVIGNCMAEIWKNRLNSK